MIPTKSPPAKSEIRATNLTASQKNVDPAVSRFDCRPSLAVFFQAMEGNSRFWLGCSDPAKGPRFLVEDLLSALSTSDSEIYVTLRVQKPVPQVRVWGVHSVDPPHALLRLAPGIRQTEEDHAVRRHAIPPLGT